MLGHTKKRPTEKNLEIHFIGSREKLAELREYAHKIGVRETRETFSLEEAFPEYVANPLGMALRGARYREGVTQRQLADKTGIPQRHISELENGKRQMGREWAKRLAAALNVADYRVFL